MLQGLLISEEEWVPILPLADQHLEFIRWLENILEHVIIVCREEVIGIHDLPEYVLSVHRKKAPEVAPAPIQYTGREREEIIQTLQRFDGHRGKSAEALQMDRSTLWRKMKKYGILT